MKRTAYTDAAERIAEALRRALQALDCQAANELDPTYATAQFMYVAALATSCFQRTYKDIRNRDDGDNDDPISIDDKSKTTINQLLARRNPDTCPHRFVHNECELCGCINFPP